MTRRAATIPPGYFDSLYESHDDPWNFRSSAYERVKYADTLAQLVRPRYAAALEVGCSIGVFTRGLAARCERLVAIDASGIALASARRDNADLGHVRFEERTIPAGVPPGAYDLIVISEVLYYLTTHDVRETARLCGAALEAGGEIVLCHWLGETDYPLTGDDAADTFVAALGGTAWQHAALRREAYRLDHLRKASA